METFNPTVDVVCGTETIAARVRLCAPDQEHFAQALIAPPPPAPALVRAFERRAELVAIGQEKAHHTY
jgi:uncharacterized protein (DUF1778 family)